MRVSLPWPAGAALAILGAATLVVYVLFLYGVLR